MAVRVSDLVKNYEDSSVSGDFTEWCEKLELVAKLQKVEDLASFLPLFLAGPAFAVYKQFSEDVKSDFPKLKAELMTSFCESSYSAYDQLRSRTLKEGEAVDVYVADLRRLVTLIGQKTPEPLLKCAFIAGLPVDVATQIKSVAAVEKLSLEELVGRARIMLSTATVDTLTHCAVGRNVTRKCFKCFSPHHSARNCNTEKSQNGNMNANRNANNHQQYRRWSVQCYTCQAWGHISRNCPQGNGGGAVSAPDAHPNN